MTATTDDERAFDMAMRTIYERARDECRYKPTYFLQMVQERGGLAAARALLAAPRLSDGFGKLATMGRLDLTVEALVLDPRWAEFFAEEELATARRRLGRKS